MGKRISYYWFAIKWVWNHRNEKNNRQKWRRFERLAFKEDWR